MAQAGTECEGAAMTTLLLGLRSNELLKGRIRNVDATEDGVVFCIEDGRTRAAERSSREEPVAGRTCKRVPPLVKKAEHKRCENLVVFASLEWS